jgi:hypothetical protein
MGAEEDLKVLSPFHMARPLQMGKTSREDHGGLSQGLEEGPVRRDLFLGSTGV